MRPRSSHQSECEDEIDWDDPVIVLYSYNTRISPRQLDRSGQYRIHGLLLRSVRRHDVTLVDSTVFRSSPLAVPLNGPSHGSSRGIGISFNSRNQRWHRGRRMHSIAIPCPRAARNGHLGDPDACAGRPAGEPQLTRRLCPIPERSERLGTG